MSKIEIIVIPTTCRSEKDPPIILKTPDKNKIGLTMTEAEILMRDLAEGLVIAKIPIDDRDYDAAALDEFEIWRLKD